MTTPISTLLQQLADKLGTTVQYLWTIEMKQAYIDGFANVIWAVFLIGAIIALSITARTLYKMFLQKKASRQSSWSDDGEGYRIGMCVAIVIAFLLSVFVVMDVVSAFQHFLNPANYAYQYIVGSLKN